MLKDIILSINPKSETYFDRKKYSFEDFCAACEKPNIAKELGCSSATLSKWLNDLFPQRPKAMRLEFWLLAQSSYKRCKSCKTIKERSAFRKNQTNTDGLNSHCKVCHAFATSRTQPHRQAKYRASLTQRTPKWANLWEIQAIYNKCPKGYHVDHIIPLQGKNVCGLHVSSNLQYLLAQDNIRKSNKMVV